MVYYLAIDIGASSGRHILASVIDNKIELEEIYRFKNNVVEKENHFYWDIDYLFKEVKNGINVAKRLNKVPKTIGIDTWAVDYILLDSNEERLSEVHAYRDHRTDTVINTFDKKQLYQITGIQFQKFNTIYQLASEDELIKQSAHSFLMVPDYLHYLLTDKKVNEYTNMTTTQLLDHHTNKPHTEILKQASISNNIFMDMVMPGTNIGSLSKKMKEELGIEAQVVIPSTHDTGSAYMATIEEDSIIISSGTWSLLGIEIETPIISEESTIANFTNEGGYNYRYRFLKNIMGLWIIQEVSRELSGKYTFGELVELAQNNHFEGTFNVNEERFLKPNSMVDEILSYFKERGHDEPKSIVSTDFDNVSYFVKH